MAEFYSWLSQVGHNFPKVRTRPETQAEFLLAFTLAPSWACGVSKRNHLSLAWQIFFLSPSKSYIILNTSGFINSSFYIFFCVSPWQWCQYSLGDQQTNSALRPAQTALVDEEGETRAVLFMFSFSSPSALLCDSQPNMHDLLSRAWCTHSLELNENIWLFQFAVEHTSQIFYTMWYQLWTFLIHCSSLSASLKIGTRNTWQITGCIMVRWWCIAAAAYSWNWRLRLLFRDVN